MTPSPDRNSRGLLMGRLYALPWLQVARLFAVGWFALSSTSSGAQTVAPQPATTIGPPAAPSSSPPSPSVPVTPGDRGSFAALWVAPLATNRFQGSGVEAGYRYHWLAGLYRLGFLQNGYAPPEGSTPLLTLERTQRLLVELEVDGQWRFHDQVTLGIGGGAAFLGDRVDISSTNGTGWTTATDGRGRIRPLVSATLAGPLFESSVTFYVGSHPEARLSLGICWGRHAKR